MFAIKHKENPTVDNDVLHVVRTVTLTVLLTERYVCNQLCTKCDVAFFFVGHSTPHVNTNENFDVDK